MKQGRGNTRSLSSPFSLLCPFPLPPLPLPLQYHVLEWTDTVFSEVIAYLMTGSCTIKASTVVALACAAEYYELEDLRQACQERFPDCLHVETVCRVLSEIEVYYDYHTAKNMLVKVCPCVRVCVCVSVCPCVRVSVCVGEGL